MKSESRLWKRLRYCNHLYIIVIFTVHISYKNKSCQKTTALTGWQPSLNSSQRRSKFKVTRLKLLVLHERSCHKEYTMWNMKVLSLVIFKLRPMLKFLSTQPMLMPMWMRTVRLWHYKCSSPHIFVPAPWKGQDLTYNRSIHSLIWPFLFCFNLFTNIAILSSAARATLTFKNIPDSTRFMCDLYLI